MDLDHCFLRGPSSWSSQTCLSSSSTLYGILPRLSPWRQRLRSTLSESSEGHYDGANSDHRGACADALAPLILSRSYSFLIKLRTFETYERAQYCADVTAARGRKCWHNWEETWQKNRRPARQTRVICCLLLPPSGVLMAAVVTSGWMINDSRNAEHSGYDYSRWVWLQNHGRVELHSWTGNTSPPLSVAKSAILPRIYILFYFFIDAKTLNKHITTTTSKTIEDKIQKNNTRK